MAGQRLAEASVSTLNAVSVIVLALALGGCFIWPLKVAEELDVQVIDAKTNDPISNADVVYLACDVHDFGTCSHARLVRTKASDSGSVQISSKRRWGIWLPAPGGMPAPNHLIAIWAPGYKAFVFSQYGNSVAKTMGDTKRQDIIEALGEVPSEQSLNDESLNPRSELVGGKIRLIKK